MKIGSVVGSERRKTALIRITSSKTALGSVALGLAISVAACADRQNPVVAGDAGGAPRAHIDTVPIAEFGEGDLHQVVGAAILLEKVVVAERSSGTLRFYAADGTQERVVGGKGEGPGEFSRLTWLQAVGGLLYASDPGNAKISVYDTAGNYIRSVRIEASEPYAIAAPVGVFSDGSIAVSAYGFPSDTDRMGVVRRSVTLLRYSPDGELVEEIARYSGSETYVEPFGRAGQLSSQLVFGRRSDVAIAGSELLLTENNGEGVLVLTQSGTKIATLEHLAPPTTVPVTPHDIRTARRDFVADETSDLKLGDIFDRMPIPDTFPTYGWTGRHDLELLRAASDGRIWILLHRGAGATGPTWSVFRQNDGDEGRFEEIHVTATQEIDVLDGHGELLVVRRWDEYDVERVELRRLIGAPRE